MALVPGTTGISAQAAADLKMAKEIAILVYGCSCFGPETCNRERVSRPKQEHPYTRIAIFFAILRSAAA